MKPNASAAAFNARVEAPFRKFKTLLTVLAGTLVCAAAAIAPAPYGTFENEAFLGDSITKQNKWTFDAEFIHAIAHPGSKAHTVSLGIAGDTARGGFARLEWDVFPAQPGRVFIMFGMNDVRRGLWADVEPSAETAKKRSEAIDTHAEYMAKIVDALTAKGIKTVLVTPSPYDVHGNYDVPALKACNDALGLCAERVWKLAEEKGLPVVDFHKPLTAFAKAHPDFRLCGKDRIHPEPRGHLLMAVELMRQTGSLPAPAVYSFDAAGSVPFTFTVKPSRIPFPINKDYLAIDAVYPLDGLLNAETLKVTGLPEGSYSLECDGRTLGAFTAAELAKGVNPARLDTPASRRAHDAYGACWKLKLTVERRRVLSAVMQKIYSVGGDPTDRVASDKILNDLHARMRKHLGPGGKGENAHLYSYYEYIITQYRENRDKIPDMEAEETAARAQMRELCSPVEYTITIKRK